ncbi:P-loop containing nucleoside triphosphate hydrolase protein [Aspergillus bertholletiae]|uniref:P-loop containing nucleoside triphosphate hydrolase protein n=1 Tax=Aspergillus bertholletiae TaxID=1226010 RepID=A0A5N7B981_9EURO|nr:P-loop containing nucleoside triphosphate hydrolase protein [Aspergillus bertholletiae]
MEVLGNSKIVREDQAGRLSRFTFQWIFQLLSIGYQRPLTETDVQTVNPNRAVEQHYNAVSHLFKRRVIQRKRLPLLFALHNALSRDFWLGGLAMFFANLLQVTSPLVLRYLLDNLPDISNPDGKHQEPLGPPLIITVALFMTQMGMSFALVHYQYLGQVVGSEVKAALTALVFDKSLKLANCERSEWTDGKVSNLITVDSQRIESALQYAHMIWSEPIAVIVALIILFNNLSYSALSGLVLLIAGAKGLDFAINWLMSGRIVINAQIDRRTTWLHAMLHNIKFVKLHAWEPYFMRQISDARATEVKEQGMLLRLRSTILSLSMALPSFAAMFSFILFMTLNRRLTSAEAFSSLALFNCLRKPLNILPVVLTQLIDAWISVQRIETFLCTPDQEGTVHWDFGAATVVNVVSGYFAWDAAHSQDLSMHNSTQDEFTILESEQLLSAEELRPVDALKPHSALQDINLTIHSGELIAVTGPVGSGKSALLSALSGQMVQLRGSITLGANAVLCPQAPWILSGTVQDNILFGMPMRQSWYDKIIEACALLPDLEAWVDRDSTLIGEQGITLSGGQKQRISLARAIYSDTDLILLDDPLSSVDADVGHHIFTKAVCGLLRSKTRILVTHQPTFLAQCSRIIRLEHGRITKIATYADFSTQDDYVPSRVEPEIGTQGPNGTEDGEATLDLSNELSAKVLSHEAQESGSIPWSIYRAYFSASGSILQWPFVITLLLLSQTAAIMSGVWLSWWVDDAFRWTSAAYIVGYVTLAVAQSILMWAYLTHSSILGLKSSSSLFSAAVKRVLSAPMSFLTVTPAGRLMSLFSNDINQLDNGVNEIMKAFFLLISTAVSTLLLICVNFPIFFAVLPFLGWTTYYTAKYYQASRRELKRYETVSRSSVAAKAVEYIAGCPTIRSFRAQDVFFRQLCRAMNQASNFSFLMSASQQWLNLRLDTMGNLLVLAVGILIVASEGSISASMSGLIMTYALAVVQIIPGVVSQTADVESSLITVERMVYYSRMIATEDSVSAEMPPPGWPQDGKISMKDVSFRYQPSLPWVLQDLTLSVSPGEKIGIIGRTGAGKSSIISLLFRLFTFERGHVQIDDVDISNLDLAALRSKLSIIPQDPTFFQGTVRSNLDPFGQVSDQTLNDALQKSRLHPQVHLDQEVVAGGQNFSLGERQLLALARAFVRNTRILLCDEATSAIDLETDDVIQATIRKTFHDRTIICIAHRLRTIIQFDRICILDQGKVVAFERPTVLYDQTPVFRQLCEKNGIARMDLAVSG